MNYTCSVQDASQSYFWSRKQVTVHPVVIYYRDKDDKVTLKSLCFISNDLDHDVVLVNKIQELTLDYIKKNLVPDLTDVEYVTDGCASQYKCCRSFFNLCQHEKRFGVRATHSFSATSHGKCACDGVGGLVKRMARKASLKRPLRDQIVNATDLFKYCHEELEGTIHFIFIDQLDMQAERMKDKNEAKVINTIPGTLSYHYFVPLDRK